MGALTKTGLGKLRFLIWVSPAGRYLLWEISNHVLPEVKGQRSKKLFVIEATPMAAWFWKIMCSLVYVKARTYYAGLTEKERDDLVDAFNDKRSDFQIMIIMYSISSQGLDLDRACHRVVIAQPANNAGIEVQAWSRLVRVSQEVILQIIRASAKNSHYIWKDIQIGGQDYLRTRRPQSIREDEVPPRQAPAERPEKCQTVHERFGPVTQAPKLETKTKQEPLDPMAQIASEIDDRQRLDRRAHRAVSVAHSRSEGSDNSKAPAPSDEDDANKDGTYGSVASNSGAHILEDLQDHDRAI
ncbi:hypothetical protein MMC25_007870 [Agyrium rufum]|nr:hypothetical protein [Agyrium rufum]